MKPRSVIRACGLLLCWAGGLAAGPAQGQAPAVQWDRTLGSANDDFGQVCLPTANGGSLMAGSAEFGASGEKAQAGCGGTDYWVVKLAAGGAVQWSRVVGGDDNDWLQGAVQTPDGGFVLAGQNLGQAIAGGRVGCDKTRTNPGPAAIWVVKLSPAGALVWERTYGTAAGGGDVGGLAAAPDGGVLVNGTCRGPAGGDKSEPGRGLDDYWVLRLDAAGAKRWDRTLGGANYDLGGVAATADGGWLVAGVSDSGVGARKARPAGTCATTGW